MLETTWGVLYNSGRTGADVLWRPRLRSKPRSTMMNELYSTKVEKLRPRLRGTVDDALLGFT